MPRALLLLALFASQAAPAHAGTERVSVAVSLQVVPSCAAKAEGPTQRRNPPALECAAEPAQSAYQAGFYWSELGTYTVYDGNVEMYD